MTRPILIAVALFLLLAAACTHRLSMRSPDGERLPGQYRFARENTGLIQVTIADGEVLEGKFATVGRATFVESYENTFGSGSVRVDGPDISSYGTLFGGVFGSSRALADSAHGDTLDGASGNSETGVKGPLFYWTASLRGDKGTTMGCYFIGSSYTGHGFGKCRNHTGKEYAVEF